MILVCIQYPCHDRRCSVSNTIPIFVFCNLKKKKIPASLEITRINNLWKTDWQGKQSPALRIERKLWVFSLPVSCKVWDPEIESLKCGTFYPTTYLSFWYRKPRFKTTEQCSWNKGHFRVKICEGGEGTGIMCCRHVPTSWITDTASLSGRHLRPSATHNLERT